MEPHEQVEDLSAEVGGRGDEHCDGDRVALLVLIVAPAATPRQCSSVTSTPATAMTGRPSVHSFPEKSALPHPDS